MLRRDQDLFQGQPEINIHETLFQKQIRTKQSRRHWNLNDGLQLLMSKSDVNTVNLDILVWKMMVENIKLQ